MIWIVLGALAGIAVGLSYGPLSFAHVPLDAALDTAARAGAALTRSSLVQVGLAQHPQLLRGCAEVVAVVGPALLCLVLAVGVRKGRSARRATIALLGALAALSFLVVPATQAVGLLTAALAVGTLLVVATGPLLLLPATAVVLAVATRTGVQVVHSTGRIGVTAGVLQADLGGPISLWRTAVDALVLLPLTAAVATVVRKK